MCAQKVSPRAAAYLRAESSDSIVEKPKLLQMAKQLLERGYSLASFKDLSEGSRVIANLSADKLTVNDLDTYAIVKNDALVGSDKDYQLILCKDGSRLTDIIEGPIAEVVAALKKNNYMPFNVSRIVTIVKL